jgi:hypothetical protein
MWNDRVSASAEAYASLRLADAQRLAAGFNVVLKKLKLSKKRCSSKGKIYSKDEPG